MNKFRDKVYKLVDYMNNHWFVTYYGIYKYSAMTPLVFISYDEKTKEYRYRENFRYSNGSFSSRIDDLDELFEFVKHSINYLKERYPNGKSY